MEGELQEVKQELSQLETEESSLNCQLEELLESQREAMVASLEERTAREEEEKSALSQINREVEAVSEELEEAKADLAACEQQSLKVLTAIEQEEAMLRTQQQVIESSLKSTQMEKQKIGEMEVRLSRIQPERPRSTLRVRSSSRSSFSSEEPSAFFEKIVPLLEGAELYKKLTQRHAFRQVVFDPLEAVRMPPEACGYGVRHLRLNQSLDRIEIRQALKPGCDASILVSQVLAVMIPQKTMAILKIQQKVGTHDLEVDCEDTDSVEVSFSFKQKCKACTTYPFSIALDQERRVELVATSYLVFKQWVNGINALVKNKRHLGNLRSGLYIK